MKDKDKTKEQLGKELEQMRQRFEDLEKSEQAAQRGRAYFESVVATVREPLLVLDADLRVVSANRSFYQTFKVTPEETEGRTIYELGNRQWDIPQLRQLLEQILPANTSFDDFEVEHDFPTIGRKVMLLNARRLYREAGKPQMILLAIEDITERKQAEARMLHLNAVLRVLRGINQLITREKDSQRLMQRSRELLVETRGYSVALMLLVDENRNFISAAGAGGFPLGEVWSEFLKRLKHGDYPRCFREALERDKPFAVLALDADECKGCDFAYARVSETAFVDRLEYEGKIYGAILARVPPEFAQDEEEQGLFHELVGDIAFALNAIEKEDERRQLEFELRESEERYRAILELGERTGEAVVMLQDDERGEAMHVFVSDAWCNITGYSREELLNMSMADLIHPRDREAAVERHRRRMRGDVLSGLYEITIIRKDGKKIPVEVTYAPSKYKGKPVGVGYIRDISERKKIQEQLMVTGRLASIGELVSGIAHELNNPLTGIIGFADLLMGRDLPASVKNDVQVIHREAIRTAQVVRNLLAFARKQPQEKTPVNVNQAIEAVLQLRAYEQKIHNIEVHTRLATNLPEVMANTFQLQQVFLNIIINAEHFMIESHGRGTLNITTERVGDKVLAVFTDDGPGIAQENLPYLFDPFFTTKEVGKGTGLGLSISHGIIAEHGGNIYAESEPGKGATFIVELPINK